jgi:SAM-dependent methyltransferase
MNGHFYEDRYYDYIERGSMRSAEAVIPVVCRHAEIRSVLDVGCGRGAWLAKWHEHGIDDFIGVDGNYVRIDKLPFSASHFRTCDLSQPFDLERRFDLVQCLEVAEHLALASADTLVQSIARHGDLLLFSAAVPGQGGEHHVNEQPLEFWIDKFAALGFEAWDVIRPALVGSAGVEPWYSYNTILLSRRPMPQLSDADRYEHSSFSVPLSWRVRNAVIGVLPRSVVNALARVKHAAMRRIGHRLGAVSMRR